MDKTLFSILLICKIGFIHQWNVRSHMGECFEVFKRKVCALSLLLPPCFNILPVNMCFSFQRKTQFSLSTYLCSFCLLPALLNSCIWTVLQFLSWFYLDHSEQELLCGHIRTDLAETYKKSESCLLGQELGTRKPRSPRHLVSV